MLAMMNLPQWIAAWTVAYFVGSIPFGFLIARAKGVDIRAHGSGNIGATNVGRVLGRRLGFFCFGLDVIKGLLPTIGAGLAMGVFARLPLPWDQALAWLAVAASAIIGHMFPVWLRFKGGKGVATGLGALVGVFPVLTIAAGGALVVWVVCVRLTKFVGISSCIAAALLPAMTWIGGWLLLGRRGPTPFLGEATIAALWPFAAVATLLALLVIYRHRGNIRRTIAGTEMRIGQRVNLNDRTSGSTTPAGTSVGASPP